MITTGLGKGAGIPLGFGGLSASVGEHIAHFYQGEEEMISVLGPYILEGIRQGDRCVVIGGSAVVEELGKWLTSKGCDTHRCEEAGQLIQQTDGSTFEEVSAGIERAATDVLTPGSFVRLAWDGNWATAPFPSISDMLRLEVLYEELSSRWGGYRLALCQLDLTRFGGDAVIDAFRAHRLCIVGQVALRSPRFLSPQTLLESLLERG